MLNMELMISDGCNENDMRFIEHPNREDHMLVSLISRLHKFR